MNKKFLVISAYTCKKQGVPKSIIAEINEGTSKTGNHYCFTNIDRRESIDGMYKVGQVLEASVNFNEASSITASNKFLTPKA